MGYPKRKFHLPKKNFQVRAVSFRECTATVIHNIIISSSCWFQWFNSTHLKKYWIISQIYIYIYTYIYTHMLFMLFSNHRFVIYRGWVPPAPSPPRSRVWSSSSVFRWKRRMIEILVRYVGNPGNQSHLWVVCVIYVILAWLVLFSACSGFPPSKFPPNSWKVSKLLQCRIVGVLYGKVLQQLDWRFCIHRKIH